MITWALIASAVIALVLVVLVQGKWTSRDSWFAADKRHHFGLVGVQAIFCRRRHQARRPPLAKIRPGKPAPAMGPAPAMSDLSWLNPTPHAIAVYASQPLLSVATQHSLPSGRYSLLGPDFSSALFPIPSFRKSLIKTSALRRRPSSLRCRLVSKNIARGK